MKQLSLAGTEMEHFHVCAFFDSREQEYDVLAPFFREGLEQGEKLLHIVDPNQMDEHRARLAENGIDVPHCEACGQLELASWYGAYLDDDCRFNRERMLATLQQVCRDAAQAGYGRVRIMGNMDWTLSHTGLERELLAYEAEVNEVLSQHRQPAICVYDTAKLSGAMMMDLLRTHPLTLVNGLVQENPFYIPASSMIAELERRELARADQAA